jgi:hypothetical protein
MAAFGRFPAAILSLTETSRLEQNHDRYTQGQCLRVLIFQEINTLKNAFQGTFIVILL